MAEKKEYRVKIKERPIHTIWDGGDVKVIQRGNEPYCTITKLSPEEMEKYMDMRPLMSDCEIAKRKKSALMRNFLKGGTNPQIIQ